MENKAPLSGWRRIGVTGRGRARKGVALCWPPAGLQATPNSTTRGGEEGCRSQARERVLLGGWSEGQEKGVWKIKDLSSGDCLLGAGKMDPPLLSREGQGSRIARPAACLLYVVPPGNFLIPDPRLRQALPDPQSGGASPCKEWREHSGRVGLCHSGKFRGE